MFLLYMNTLIVISQFSYFSKCNKEFYYCKALWLSASSLFNLTYCNEAILLNFIKVTLEFCYKFSQMNKILKTAWIKA